MLQDTRETWRRELGRREWTSWLRTWPVNFAQFNVASVSIWPPLTMTEKVMAYKEQYGMTKARSPLFTGRAVVALAADPKIMEKTGR